MSWRNTLADLARAHLPAETADKWIELLRPAFGLGAKADGPLVGGCGSTARTGSS